MFLIHGQAGRSIASHVGVFRGARFSSLPGKFCPGISFTICTNQFNLPKNDREGLNPVSKMALKKWITNSVWIFRPEKQENLFRCSVAPGNFLMERSKKSTVRVKGGMSLRNGMWYGFRNDIIMRNVRYGNWRKEIN